jgi:pyridoxamine 5'-phosphate oxidase family protein
MPDTALTEPQVTYLTSQRLGRLATIAPDGTLQNNPVGFHYNAELDTIDIFGYRMGATRKFRNVAINPNIAFVVDDIRSVDPWIVRGVEIRGVAEALSDHRSTMRGMSNEIIRIHPRLIIAWNVETESTTESDRPEPARAT